MFNKLVCRNIIMFGFVCLSFSCLSRASDYPKVNVLLNTSETVTGEDFAYPQGTANITAVVIKLLPKQSTGWHKHEVPLFAQILSGELTVEYRNIGTRKFYTNDTLIEAIDTPHIGTNTGDVTTRILAVFIGADGSFNTVSEPDIIESDKQVQ